MAVNGTHGFKSQKNIHRQKPNLTLRLVTIHWGLKTWNNQSVQKTEQYLYSFFTSDPPHCPTAWARHNSWRVTRLLFLLLAIRLISVFPPPISQTDHWHYLISIRSVNGECAQDSCIRGTDCSFRVFRPQCIITSRRVSFGFVWVCIFVSLKVVSPIDCHYTNEAEKCQIFIFVWTILLR